MGTLFSIRSLFRARGVFCFWLTLIFYGRASSWLFYYVGLPDVRADQRILYPISGGYSWFFTAHTLVTLFTIILHPGMAILSRSAYFLVNVFIVWLTLWWGVSFTATYWVNACLMYVFAGYFGVHGWPLRPSLTWILLIALYRLQWPTVSTDIFHKFPRKWHWALVTFRRFIWRPRRGLPIKCPKPGWVGYQCPLSYFWGANALYAFRSLSLPSGLSRAIIYLGPMAFMIHWIDYNPVIRECFPGWVRMYERQRTPPENLLSAMLVTTQIAVCAIFLEIFRVYLFDKASMVTNFVYSSLRSVWSRYGNGAGLVAGFRSAWARKNKTETVFARLGRSRQQGRDYKRESYK
jgi:hypothetical protein